MNFMQFQSIQQFVGSIAKLTINFKDAVSPPQPVSHYRDAGDGVEGSKHLSCFAVGEVEEPIRNTIACLQKR